MNSVFLTNSFQSFKSCMYTCERLNLVGLTEAKSFYAVYHCIKYRRTLIHVNLLKVFFKVLYRKNENTSFLNYYQFIYGHNVSWDLWKTEKDISMKKFKCSFVRLREVSHALNFRITSISLIFDLFYILSFCPNPRISKWSNCQLCWQTYP